MIKKFILFISVFLLSINSLISLEITEFGSKFVNSLSEDILKKRIGVSRYEIPDSEKGSNLDKILSAEITGKLSKKGIVVYERDDLMLVIKEKQLSQSGILTKDDKTFSEAQQIDYIVSGTVFRINEDRIRIITKIIDIQNLGIVFTNEEIVNFSGVKTPGHHIHNGFYYNFQIGNGYQYTYTSGIDYFNSINLFGNSTLVSMKFGGAVNSSLILCIYMDSLFSDEPSIQSNPDILLENKLTGKHLSVSFVGPYLSYYFPSNYFASFGISSASAAYKDTNNEIEIDNGYGIEVGFGREWWVSENWALGFAIKTSYSHINLTDIDVTFKTSQGPVIDNNFIINTLSFNVVFSATYN